MNGPISSKRGLMYRDALSCVVGLNAGPGCSYKWKLLPVYKEFCAVSNGNVAAMHTTSKAKPAYVMLISLVTLRVTYTLSKSLFEMSFL